MAYKEKLTGEGMRMIREGLGMTQAKFAEATRTSTRAIGRWENDERPIPAYIALLVLYIEMGPVYSECPRCGRDL